MIKNIGDIDTRWMVDAKCRSEKVSNSYFFADFEKAGPAVKSAMVNICSGCPVIEKCRNYAIEAAETGLWAGVYFISGKPKNPRRVRYLDINLVDTIIGSPSETNKIIL